MGIFDFFKKKKPKTFETNFGLFRAIDKGELWIKEDEQKKIYYYVNGNSEMPNLNEVAFFNGIEEQVKGLDTEINARLVALLKEIEVPVLFTDWKERYQMLSYQVFELDKDNEYWEFSLRNDNLDDDDGIIMEFIFEVKNGKIIHLEYNA